MGGPIVDQNAVDPPLYPTHPQLTTQPPTQTIQQQIIRRDPFYARFLLPKYLQMCQHYGWEFPGVRALEVEVGLNGEDSVVGSEVMEGVGAGAGAGEVEGEVVESLVQGLAGEDEAAVVAAESGDNDKQRARRREKQQKRGGGRLSLLRRWSSSSSSSSSLWPRAAGRRRQQQLAKAAAAVNYTTTPIDGAVPGQGQQGLSATSTPITTPSASPARPLHYHEDVGVGSDATAAGADRDGDADVGDASSRHHEDSQQQEREQEQEATQAQALLRAMGLALLLVAGTRAAVAWATAGPAAALAPVVDAGLLVLVFAAVLPLVGGGEWGVLSGLLLFA